MSPKKERAQTIVNETNRIFSLLDKIFSQKGYIVSNYFNHVNEEHIITVFGDITKTLNKNLLNLAETQVSYPNPLMIGDKLYGVSVKAFLFKNNGNFKKAIAVLNTTTLKEFK